MTESRDRNICSRAEGVVRARMYATVLSMGESVPIPEPVDPQIEALRKIASKLDRRRLSYMLALDLRYAMIAGVELDQHLKITSEEIVKNNLKGGE